MLLYHGTSERAARKALSEGIKPRSHGFKSNWGHTAHSHRECVYLTDAYGLYFAINAASRSDDGKPAIIEVDTEKLEFLNFRPDEDVLAQANHRHYDGNKTLIQLTKEFRKEIDSYAHLWQESLNAMGTCAYKGIIPPEAITRIAVIDHKKQASLCWAGMDPSISILNYRFVGEKYKNMTRWIFGEEVSDMWNQWENRDGIELISAAHDTP